MPLLLNLWAQPTGRVLSLDLRYSKLARCFPILTLFDSLSLLLDILYHRIFIRIHPSLEASMILVKRFSNRTAHTSIYFDKYTRPEFVALRKGRWQQWLLFVLSCLLPAIKLMSLKGIPWTKSVGLVWLFSWIWLEIATLSLLALAKGDDLEDILKVIDSLPKRDYLNTSPISITHRNVSSNKLREIEMVDPFPRFKACSRNINDGLIITAIAVHGFLGFWMLQDISLAGIELESSLPRSLVEAAIVMFIPVCLRLGRSLYSLPPLKLPNSPFSFADTRNREPVGVWIGDRTEETQPSTSFREAVPVTALVAVYLSVLVFRSWYAPREVGLVILHAALFLAFGAQIWLAGWIVITIYTYIRRLIDGYYFSYMRPGTGDGDRVFWMAMLLFGNFGLCVSWYAFRFDNEGTENPPWTSAFG